MTAGGRPAGTGAPHPKHWCQGAKDCSTPTPATHTLPVARSAVGNHVLFQAHIYDEDIGIYLMRARVYDPRTGQFLQRDPIPFVDGVNVYAGMATTPLIIGTHGALAPAAILGACLVGGAFNVGIEALKNRVSEKDMTGKQVLDAAAVGCVSSVAGLAGGWLLGAGAKALGYGKFAAGATGALGGGAAAGSTARALVGEDINLQTIAFDAALGGLGWGVGNGLGAIGRGVGSALRKPTGCAGGACLLKGRPCKCFTEDTEVWTPSGLVPIAQIKAGDKVNCAAPDGEWGTCAVIAPYSREYFGEMVALTVAGETAQRVALRRIARVGHLCAAPAGCESGRITAV